MRERIPIAPSHDGLLNFVRDSYGLTEVHRHRELEFNLVVSGTAYYIVDDRRQLVTAGTLIWLFPAQEHLLVDYDDDFGMWVVVLAADARSRLFRMAKPAFPTADISGVTFVRRLGTLDSSAIGALCSSVRAAHGDPARFNAGLSYLVLEAWHAYVHGAKLESGIDLSPVVSASLRLLSGSGGCIGLTSMAKTLNVSSSWLSRAFHRETGAKYVDYCNRLRLMRFIEIRQSSPARNLTDVALDAGFGSYAQFYRVYRAAFRRSPSACAAGGHIDGFPGAGNPVQSVLLDRRSGPC